MQSGTEARGRPALILKQSPDVGAIEIVQSYPPPDTFTVYAAGTFYHIDNLLLTPVKFESDVFLTQIGLSIVPYSTYRWTPRVTVEQAFVRNQDFAQLNYEAQTLTVDSRFDLTGDKSLSLDAGVGLRRHQTDRFNQGEFYKHVEPFARLNWTRPLSRRHPVFFYGSGGVYWRQASPGFENRLNTGVLLSVIGYPTARLGVQPFAEVGYQYYPNDSPSIRDREDVVVRSGLSVLWQPVRGLLVNGSFLWVGSYSSAPNASYEILPSVTLSASYGFW